MSLSRELKDFAGSGLEAFEKVSDTETRRKQADTAALDAKNKKGAGAVVTGAMQPNPFGIPGAAGAASAAPPAAPPATGTAPAPTASGASTTSPSSVTTPTTTSASPQLGSQPQANGIPGITPNQAPQTPDLTSANVTPATPNQPDMSAAGFAAGGLVRPQTQQPSPGPIAAGVNYLQRYFGLQASSAPGSTPAVGVTQAPAPRPLPTTMPRGGGIPLQGS